MSFDTLERSAEGSQPVELFEFVYQGGFFRYTSSPEDITVLGVPFAQASIARSEIDEDADVSKSTLTLTAPTDFAISEIFNVAPPSDVVNLTVYRVQLGDLTDMATIWVGRVTSVGWPPNHSELTCESIFTSLKRPGLRRPYGRNCPHVLYGAACRASGPAFRQTVTIDSVSGLAVNSAGVNTSP